MVNGLMAANERNSSEFEIPEQPCSDSGIAIRPAGYYFADNNTTQV